MNDDQERPLRMLVVYGQEGGFYVALVPPTCLPNSWKPHSMRS